MSSTLASRMVDFSYILSVVRRSVNASWLFLTETLCTLNSSAVGRTLIVWALLLSFFTFIFLGYPWIPEQLLKSSQASAGTRSCWRLETAQKRERQCSTCCSLDFETKERASEGGRHAKRTAQTASERQAILQKYSWTRSWRGMEIQQYGTLKEAIFCCCCL